METSRRTKPKSGRLAEILAAEKTIAEMPDVDADDLRQRLAAEPNDAWLHFWQGLVLAQRTDHEAATREFGLAVQGDCDHWRVQWCWAQSAARVGLLDVVDRACAAVLKAEPEFWFARELPKHARGFYAQMDQDQVIERFFEEQAPRCKMFVEVGAFDGRHYSNVRRLHERQGWTGVSIEPVEKNYAKLVQSYQGTRVKCVRAAVSDQEGPLEINVSTYPHLPDWGSDVATFEESEMGRWTKKFRAHWVKERVPARRLTTILDEHAISDFDLLSIDAEGHDLEIVRSLDFSRFQPQLVVVEYGKHRQEILGFLVSKGYSPWLDNGQDLFMAQIHHGARLPRAPGTLPDSVNYSGATGQPPFQEIQKDVEDSIHRRLNRSPSAIQCIVIVGGYLGNEIQAFLRNYPNAEIHVFEPSRRYFKELAGRFGSQPRVHCHHCAVGDFDGVTTFHEGSRAGIGSLLTLKTKEDAKSWIPRNTKPAEEYSVPVVTLDHFAPLQDKAIDLLWCDVQGAELKVLSGAAQTLRRCHALFLEVAATKTTYHGQCLLSELRRFLSERDFYLSGIGLCHSGNGMGNALWLRAGLTETSGPGHEIKGAGSVLPPGRMDLPGAVAAISEERRGELARKLNPHLLRYVPIEKATMASRVNPQVLVNPLRFDLMAKLLYARYRKLAIESDFARRLYDEHLRAFNSHKERDGSGKEGLQAFLDSFHHTLDSIETRGFDPETSFVPVGHDNVLIEGAHRVAAALLFDQPVSTLVFDWEPKAYDYCFFQKRGLAGKWLDAMAFEYCRLKPNIYLATVFPSAVGKDEEIHAVLGQHGRICCVKRVPLNFGGAVNLMRQMYSREKWLGDWRDGFAGARSKAAGCFRYPGPLRLFVFESPSLEEVKEVKAGIRDLFGIGNHSVHINDTHDQALLLGQLLLNDNSVHFLNHARPRYLERFCRHLEEYRRWLAGQPVETDHFCIDGSAVLAAYGLRDARDLDFLHFGHDGITPDHPKIGSHNSEVHHHVTTRDDIIFNPENHFFYQGVKFASLEIIRRMKLKRGEEKDRQDVALIESLSATPKPSLSPSTRKLQRWFKIKSLELKRKIRKPYTFSKRWFSHSPHWGRHVLPWAEDRGPLNILEIGSYEGASACWLLEHLMDHPGSRLTCVDQWEQRSGQRVYEESMQSVHETFLKNIRATGKADRVTVLRGPSRQVLPDIQGERFDLIYVDGDHSAEGVHFDSVQAFRLVNEGGMILWDDYDRAASVKEGVDRACQEFGGRLHRFGKNVYYLK